MKLNKILLTAAAFCALAQAASAQTVNIYITGSTAFRSAIYNAVRSLYTVGFTENTDNSAKPSGANHMTWSGSIGSVNGGAGTVHAFVFSSTLVRVMRSLQGHWRRGDPAPFSTVALGSAQGFRVFFSQSIS